MSDYNIGIKGTININMNLIYNGNQRKNDEERYSIMSRRRYWYQKENNSNMLLNGTQGEIINQRKVQWYWMKSDNENQRNDPS